MGWSGAATRTVVRGLVLALALVTLGAAWTISSPIGSSPDDDFHLGSIWCSTWAKKETCIPTDPPLFTTMRSVLIPEAVSATAMCYRRHPALSGHCPLSTDTTKLDAARTNDGEYPGGYYDLMGLLIGRRPARSVLAMRFASWVVGIGLVALAALVAPRRLRRPYLAGVVATSVPMGLFLLTSTNPSGMVFAAVPATWCASMGYLEATSRWQRITAALVASAALGLALISRVDAGLYLAACAGIVIALHPVTRRVAKGIAAATAAIALTAIVAGYPRRITQGFGTPFDREIGDVVWQNLRDLPLLWTGSIGTSKLGWLDTAMPVVVSACTIPVVVLLLIAGLRRVDRRKGVALAMLGAVLIAYPMYFLTVSRSLVGENFQARYLLPILPVFIAVALLATKSGKPTFVARPFLVLMGAALSVAHSFALHAQLRRYITGTDITGFDLDKRVEWWWPDGPRPMAVWWAGTIAFAVAVVVIGQGWLWREPAAPALPPPRPEEVR